MIRMIGRILSFSTWENCHKLLLTFTTTFWVRTVCKYTKWGESYISMYFCHSGYVTDCGFMCDFPRADCKHVNRTTASGLF